VAQPLPVEPKIKGVAVREFLRRYVATRGTTAIEKAVEGMPPEHARQLTLGDPTLGLLASTWYPAPMIHRILDGITAGLRSHERQALIREAAFETIHNTLTGVYKLLFQAMMSPDRYARNAQQLFSRYFNTGTMVKTAIDTPDGPGHRSVIRDWTGHHPVLCDTLVHTAEYVYGALGCKDLTIKKTGCVASGEAECTFIIAWRKVG
jgi:hypothetical protein